MTNGTCNNNDKATTTRSHGKQDYMGNELALQGKIGIPEYTQTLNLLHRDNAPPTPTGPTTRVRTCRLQ